MQVAYVLFDTSSQLMLLCKYNNREDKYIHTNITDHTHLHTLFIIIIDLRNRSLNIGNREGNEIKQISVVDAVALSRLLWNSLTSQIRGLPQRIREEPI